MEVLKKKPEKRFHSGFVVSTELRVVALDHPVHDGGLLLGTATVHVFTQLFVSFRYFKSKGDFLASGFGCRVVHRHCRLFLLSPLAEDAHAVEIETCLLA